DLLLEAVSDRVGPVEASVTGDLREDLIGLVVHLGELLGSEPVGSVAAALILESRRDPALDEVRRRFIGRRRGAAARVIGSGIDRAILDPGTDPDALADELASPVFFRSLVLHESVERDWAEAHVDRWLDRHGGAR
ncbi:MAG: TetR-like C-terminal domain-containing protein, partial [Acidimicrobiia bacterium]